MTTSNKILIFLLIAQIAVFAIIAFRPPETGIGPPENLFPGLDTASVELLRIFEAHQDDEVTDKPAVELKRENGSWILSSHYDYPADSTKINDLIRKFPLMQSRGPMTSNPARHSQLAVGENEYGSRVEIVSKGVKKNIFIGNPVGARKVALRIAGNDDVHAVSGISSTAIHSEPGHWIISEYFNIPSESIASITITRPDDKIHLERDEANQWTVPDKTTDEIRLETEDIFDDEIIAEALITPIKTIDTRAVDRLVNSVARIQAASPAPADSDFSSPLAKVEIRIKGQHDDPEMEHLSQQHILYITEAPDDMFTVRMDDDGRPVHVRKWSMRQLVEIERDELFESGE